VTNEEMERWQSILDLVEYPCLSKNVGAPGSLMRRANDLGRELADLRKLRDDVNGQLETQIKES
jgi:hypothetical protein